MRFPTLVFDIETLTDLKAGRIYIILICQRQMLNRHSQKSVAKNPAWIFSVLPYMKSFVFLVCGLMNQVSDYFLLVGNTIRKLKFYRNFIHFDKRHPTLVSWNGSQFDLPVILFRAMYHGLFGTGLFDQGELDSQKRLIITKTVITTVILI